jgi:hypothetical protein
MHSVINCNGGRVTRLVFENIAQNMYAQPIFLSKLVHIYIAFSVQISSLNIWALSVMKKLPKKTIAQEAKIRPIWSPWPASHLDR